MKPKTTYNKNEGLKVKSLKYHLPLTPKEWISKQ